MIIYVEKNRKRGFNEFDIFKYVIIEKIKEIELFEDYECKIKIMPKTNIEDDKYNAYDLEIFNKDLFYVIKKTNRMCFYKDKLAQFVKYNGNFRYVKIDGVNTFVSLNDFEERSI